MSVAGDVGIGLAAVAAVAAAASARTAARGVALGHRPYVYGERGSATAESGSVRLHNDGPGTAVEVRWRICAPGAEPTGWSDPIRAMQSGEIAPPEGQKPPPTTLPLGIDGHAFGWFVETEFGDIRGARWRLRNERGEPSAAAVLTRLRSGRFDLWRSR
jgi:hypothetical protein